MAEQQYGSGDARPDGHAGEGAAGETDPQVQLVTLPICSLCLDGAGGECHVPGCALWMKRAPDVSIRDHVEPPADTRRRVWPSGTTTCPECGGALFDYVRGDACPCCEFASAMLAEIRANAHKGGRCGLGGWIASDYRVLVGEVLYHAAKLSYAARQLAQGDGDRAKVLEFAADTANMAMMVADNLGAFAGSAPADPLTKSKPTDV